MTKSYKLTKFTCCYSYLSMSSVFCVPPMLFLTFHRTYGVSYTLLGTLVLINFCSQLCVDLVFSFFARFFNIKLTLRIMPLLTSAGLIIYAVVPALFPSAAYLGLALGTVVFSIAAGLSEVLLSPLVAAIPSDTPGRDMSLLHSLYAYGVVTMVGISSLFFALFGTENWTWLILFLAALPLLTAALFCLCPIPDLNLDPPVGEKSAGNKCGLMLCVLCIFLGSASENIMTNWISGYAESALKISKAAGDVLGLALFAVCLGLVRSWHAKTQKNITAVLIAGMTGSVFCYLAAALFSNPAVCLAACVCTGLCTSMLWPGMLIFMEEKMPGVGVAAYALMAAGGDFGASTAPQLMGAIVDSVSRSPLAASLSQRLSLTSEQLGMKAGMLCSAVFPVLGVCALAACVRYFKKAKSAK